MYSLENEIIKSRIKQEVRNFFTQRGFIEVDTPLLSPTFIPEHTIQLFKTKKTGEFTEEKDMYLLPSPELYMKRLLALYRKPIFQISKAFRNSEQTSRMHNNEFTMLEFYCPDSDYNDTINITAELLKKILANQNAKLDADTQITTVSDILKKYTSFTLGKIHKREVLDKISSRFNLNLPANEEFDDTFNRIFVHIVEPELAKCKQPIFIKDYPIEINCLARKKNSLERERFELYYKGIELANGYSEMWQEEEIKKLIEYEKKYFSDTEGIDNYIANYTLENSSGVAIGLDRLIALSCGFDCISDINYS